MVQSSCDEFKNSVKDGYSDAKIKLAKIVDHIWDAIMTVWSDNQDVPQVLDIIKDVKNRYKNIFNLKCI